MNKNTFNGLASALNYTKAINKQNKNVYTSTYEGFPIALSLGHSAFGNAANALPVLAITLNKEADSEFSTYNKKDILKEVKSLKDTHKKKMFHINIVKDVVLISIQIKKKDDPNEIINGILHDTVEVLKYKGVSANFKCPICHQNNCDAMYFDEKNTLVPFHNACKTKLSEQTIQDFHETESTGNNILGILGILIGGFVGAIPTIFTITVLNYQFFYLELLIPLAAFYGFKLLKGQPGILPSILIAVWSLFQVFLILIITNMIYWKDYYGITVDFFTAMEGIFSSDIGDIMKGTWFGLFAVVIGLIPTFSESLNTANKRSKTHIKAIDNFVPYASKQEPIIENQETV